MEQQVISANRLLNRKPEESYIDEWTTLLQMDVSMESDADKQSVVVFRLAGEWLAISTRFFAEIAHVRTLHCIPHRSGPILQGIINLRGQLRLCVSLHKLLELEEEQAEATLVGRKKYARLVAIRKGEDHWIFPVDEVFGNYHFAMSDLQNVPVTVSKSAANYLKGVVAWEGKSFGYLDEELLFQSLRRIL